MNTAANRLDNFIGVDVSKHWLDYAVLSRKNQEPVTFRLDNTTKGFSEFQRKIRGYKIALNKKTIVVLEHTGIYGKKITDFLQKKKCKLCIESPLQIKKSIGITRGKDDVVDAERIATYAFRNSDKLRLWEPPKPSILMLKTFLNNRERMMRIAGQIEVPIKELKTNFSRAQMALISKVNKAGLAGAEKSLKLIDKEINRLIKSDKSISKQHKLLMSIPGIGRITAAMLIAWTFGFTRYNTGKQLACYAGVVPFTYTSGLSTNVKGRVSRLSNKKLKVSLHMAALAQTRNDSDLHEYYLRKVAEGKNKMLVLNNIKNKLLLRAVAIIKKGKPYEANYEYAKNIIEKKEK